jgi:hypothetical protein
MTHSKVSQQKEYNLWHYEDKFKQFPYVTSKLLLSLLCGVAVTNKIWRPFSSGR